MTTVPATPSAPLPTAPTSPSQAAAQASPAPSAPLLANIEPKKITKTPVQRAHRDIERTIEAFDKALENLASMAAGKVDSANPTVQRVVGVVKSLVVADIRGVLADANEELDHVLTELAEL